MLRSAYVQEVSQKRINRQHGLLVVVTRYYPRFLKRTLVDEYLPVLGPKKELLKLFKETEKETGDHDLAFEQMQYQSHFELEDFAWSDLERLSLLSKSDDVFLICHCPRGQYCHRDLLMILAQLKYGAEIGPLAKPYTEFYERHRL